MFLRTSIWNIWKNLILNIGGITMILSWREETHLPFELSTPPLLLWSATFLGGKSCWSLEDSSPQEYDSRFLHQNKRTKAAKGHVEIGQCPQSESWLDHSLIFMPPRVFYEILHQKVMNRISHHQRRCENHPGAGSRNAVGTWWGSCNTPGNKSNISDDTDNAPG